MWVCIYQFICIYGVEIVFLHTYAYAHTFLLKHMHAKQHPQIFEIETEIGTGGGRGRQCKNNTTSKTSKKILLVGKIILLKAIEPERKPKPKRSESKTGKHKLSQQERDVCIYTTSIGCTLDVRLRWCVFVCTYLCMLLHFYWHKSMS